MRVDKTALRRGGAETIDKRVGLRTRYIFHTFWPYLCFCAHLGNYLSREI